MSSLSPTAKRFIELALTQQDAHRQLAEWHHWASGPNPDLSSYLAQVALHAMSGMALRIEEQIVDDRVESAEAARLENDLGYIADIEAVLLEHIGQPFRAYG